jgi:hypothetical protein
MEVRRVLQFDLVRTGCQGTYCHCPNPSALDGRAGSHREIQLGDAHRGRRLQCYSLLVERETMLEQVDRPDPDGSVSESALYDVEPVGNFDSFPVMYERVLEAGLVLLDIVFGADLLDERRI